MPEKQVPVSSTLAHSPTARLALPCAGFVAACVGLAITAQVADAPRLLGVAALYAAAVIAVFLVRPRPEAVALGFGATIGVALLGLASYSPVLVPSLGLWIWAFWTRSELSNRRWWPTALAVGVGVSVGIWAVLIPAIMGRGS